MQLSALFRLGFPSAPGLLSLNLAACHDSQAHSTKGTPPPLRAATACGSMVSGSLSLPSRGAFHLPSRYYALSVAAEYSALEGGPPGFRQDSTCPDVLRYALGCPSDFAYGAFTLSRRPSQTVRLSSSFLQPRRAPYNPAGVAACGLGSSHFARRYCGNLV